MMRSFIFLFVVSTVFIDGIALYAAEPSGSKMFLCIRRFENLSPSEIKSREDALVAIEKAIKKRTVDYENALKEHGIQYETSRADTQAEIIRKEAKKERQKVYDRYTGKMLTIRSLPKPERASPNTSALFHPEMQKYFDELHSWGYELNMDTSLPILWDSPSQAYFLPKGKYIGISPETTWDQFIHEFEHARFDRLVTPKYGDLGAAVRRGEKLKDLLTELEPWKIKLLEGLMKVDMPLLATNETLAYTTQLRSLGWYRIFPKYNYVKKGPSFYQNNSTYQAKTVAKIFVPLLGIAGVTWYYYSDKGEMIGKDEKGNWVKARPATKESDLSSEDWERRKNCLNSGADAACEKGR